MYKQPFVIAIASLSVLIALAGCAPSPMAQDCERRNTIIEGFVLPE